jgi:hypothetical protein
MAPACPLHVPIYPNAAESAVLATASSYHRSAGLATSTPLSYVGTDDCAITHAVRDQYGTRATLCLTLLDAVDNEKWLLRLPRFEQLA